MRRTVCLCASTFPIALLVFSCGAGRAYGQGGPPAAPPAASASSPQNVAPPPSNPDLSACVEPAPLLSLDEYDGAFKKTIGFFARKLERKTAHRPHHRPGATLCSLDTGEKFRLFVDDTLEPGTFLVAGFYGGLSQAQNSDAKFGQGAPGFGKRYGAALADQASSSFFGTFLYPAIFRQDPRYYRMSHGSGSRRLWHAVRHTFVARGDSGKLMFNFSEWMGTASAQVLSNVYHPGNRRGVAPAVQGAAVTIAADMGLDVVREFWPEIAREFRLPFRRRVPEPAQAARNEGSK